jgi:hypothetical protein
MLMKAKVATKKHHALNVHLVVRTKQTHVLVLIWMKAFSNVTTATLKVRLKIVTLAIVKVKSQKLMIIKMRLATSFINQCDSFQSLSVNADPMVWGDGSGA